MRSMTYMDAIVEAQREEMARDDKVFLMGLDVILESVAKTKHLVIADPCHDFGSIASHISALVAEDGFWSLEAPIKRVVTPHTHIPYNRSMEQTLYPTPDRIATAVREVLE